MNVRSILLLPPLIALSATSFAQTRLVPLPMDPPKGILESMPLGSIPGSQVLHLSVELPYGDPVGIQRFVDSVSDPTSPNYHQFISPEEVGRRFGLPAAAVQKVTSYLTSQGMTIHLVAKNRISILAQATVAQAEAAFHTSIESFMTLTTASIDTAANHFAYTATPAVPAEISPYISYVGGLENFTQPEPRGNYPVSPPQLQSFYNVTPMYSEGSQGLGRTIAISNFDGYSLNNVKPWYTQWGLPTPSVGITKNISIENPPGDSSGQNASAGGEGDLDIQSVLGIAPLCNLIIYDAGSGNNDLLGVLTLEQNDNTADIVTESYGWSGPSSFYLAAHNIHLSMSAQGMTYMAASGDHGTASINGNSQTAARPYPDEDPEVLIVGGTTTQTASQGGALSSQTGWSGSGGGWAVTTDPFNLLPSYQKGTGVPTNINARLSPDVALNADPNTGFYIYLQSGEGGVPSTGFYIIGGTSGASPTFAGCLGDTEEQIIAKGGLPANSKGKQRFGRIQDLLYSFNGSSAIFTDITSGSNGTLPNGNTSNAGTGWDMVTGWGVVNFNGLAIAESPSNKVTGVSVSLATVEGGSPTSVTGTVTIQNAAPAGGLAVSLSSSSSGITVPASVTVASGATSAQFALKTNSVATTTVVTIIASLPGSSSPAHITVTPPHATGLTVSPTSVIGGSSTTVTGTVTVAEAAPAGGLPVALSSNNAAASVPATATVPAGATSGTFSITTSGVAASTSVTISATSGSQTQTSKLTVTPAALSGLTLSASSAYGGQAVTGTVTLTGQAGSGGDSVKLTLSSASLGTLSTSTLLIPSGKASATFTFTATPVSVAATETVTATFGTSKSAGVTVRPAILSSVTANPASVIGGVQNSAVTFTLNSPAGPGGTVVLISATPATAAKFAVTSVTVPAGSTSYTATLTSLPVATNTSVSVPAVAGATVGTSVIVQAASMTGFSLSSNSVAGGTTVTGTITLNGPAPAAGRVVTVSSSNTAAATVPLTVTVPSGQTSATFTITTKLVSATTSVNIKATLGTTSLTQALSVRH